MCVGGAEYVCYVGAAQLCAQFFSNKPLDGTHTLCGK